MISHVKPVPKGGFWKVSLNGIHFSKGLGSRDERVMNHYMNATGKSIKIDRIGNRFVPLWALIKYVELLEEHYDHIS